VNAIKIVLVAVIILFLAGCSSGRDINTPIAYNFKQGHQGVEVSILPQYPPEQIIEGGSFTIGLEIANRGAYDTMQGEVSIIGLNPVFNPLEKDFEVLRPLLGRGLTSPDGDFYVEEFQGTNEFIPPGATEYRAKFLVLAEYDYQTVLNADVCINPAVLKIEAQKDNCQVQERMSFGGQGAPLAITSVEEIVSTRDTQVYGQFTLTIENQGDGEVISPVRVDEVKVGNRRLQCTTGNPSHRDEIPAEVIKENKGVIVCTLLEPLRGAYTTTLSAVLTYTYRTSETGEFTIRRIGGG
jgi:hypothetical protein